MRRNKPKSFEGIWIPIKVLDVENLTNIQKIIYSMIINLCKNDPCFASNEYFSRVLHIDTTGVSRHISKIKRKGFIDVKLIREKNGTVSRREITLKKDHSAKLLSSSTTQLATLHRDLRNNAKELTKISPLRNNAKDIINDIYNKDYNKVQEDDSFQLIDDDSLNNEVVKDEESLFESFWNAIPQLRRINKVKTKKEWKEALHKKSGEELIKAMELFAQRVEPKYIKTSFNWLKDEYYNAIPEKKKRGAFEYRP